MRIETEVRLNFSDVLIRPKRSNLSSRKDVSLQRGYHFLNSKQRYHGVPIMAANMDGVGTFAMAEQLAVHSLFTCLVKHYPADQIVSWIDKIGFLIREYWAYSLGITQNDVDKFEHVYHSLKDKNSLKYVCIDVANGYTQTFIDFIAKFRDAFPDIVVIAGNVATGEMTEELLLNGADIVKIGIGPGSVCTTRLKTGVGYPQLSAIIECADAAHGLKGHIIGDGGCTIPADVAKAFGAGADFVMLGGMLSGHDESGLPTVEKDGKKFIEFHGMSSEVAMIKHYGKKDSYRSAEGKSVYVPYRGPVKEAVEDILGGIRSTCTYVGADCLKNLSKCTTFIRVMDTHNRVFEKG